MLRKYSTLFTIFTLVLISKVGTLHAWSWADAQAYTLQKSLALDSAQQAKMATELAFKNASSLHQPTLSLIGGAQESFDDDGFTYQTAIGGRVQLPIFEGWKITNASHVANEKDAQAEITLRLARVRLLRELRVAFSNLIYVKELKKLRKAIVEDREQNLKFVKLRYDGGQEFQWVYLTSKSKLDRAKLAELEARLAEAEALTAMENILGGALPIQSVDEVDSTGFFSTEENYDLDHLLTGIDGHPEIILEDSRIRESEFTVKVRQGEPRPSIGFQSDLLFIDTDDQSPTPFWSAAVRLTMPIYEAQRNQRNIQIAKIQLRRAKLESDQKKLALRSRITRAFKRYEAAKENIEVSASFLKASRDRLRVVSNQYELGVTNYLNFERAIDDSTSSEERMLQAKLNYETSWAILDAEIGKELGS